jgi:murein DD-endopeptidase MepM/ murein hydrolase activator NlpD
MKLTLLLLIYTAAPLTMERMNDYFSPSSDALSYWLDPTFEKSQAQALQHLSQVDATSQTATTTQSDFRSLLEVLLLGMKMNGNTGTSSEMGELVAPLMLTLLEQVLAKQVNGQANTGPQSGNPTNSRSGEIAPTGSRSTPSGLPIQGRLTQDFHPGHTGIDWGTPLGTPVKATMDGKVIYAGWNNQGYGNLVIVENGSYRTYYAHLSQIPVSVGQTVGAGCVIGLSGSTGNSTGPHLHYEVRVNGPPVNPNDYLSAAA